MFSLLTNATSGLAAFVVSVCFRVCALTRAKTKYPEILESIQGR